MYCKLCQTYNSTGLNGSRTWVDKGCRSMRLDKVNDHENSSQHRHALAESLNETVNNMADKVNTEAQKAVLDAMKVLEFILTNNLPLSLFGKLTDLCVEVGSKTLANLRLAKNASYTSHDIVQELLSLLHSEVKNEVKTAVRLSPCFSTMVDEVCDMTIEKHMALCCKYVSDSGDVKTSYMSDTTLKTATADVITDAIMSEVANHDLMADNMTGFGSDGAAVFTGKKNGVAARLKEQLPGIVTIHCKDHRLALACRDSFQKVPLFKKTDKLLEDLYRYYKNSSVRTASLKAVQLSFQEAPVNIKEAKHHRWLSHDKAVTSIVRSYRSLVVDLESNTVADDPVGNGILKQLKNPVNVHILHLLADVLPHLATLSLFFQSNDTHIGMANAKVEATLRTLTKRKDTNGIWLSKVTSLLQELELTATSHDIEIFQAAREQFLNGVISNIGSRFADTEVMEALAVLDLSSLPEIPVLYGTTEMEILGEKFRMDVDNLQTQWQSFTELMTATPPNSRSLTQLAHLFHGQQHSHKGLTSSYPLVARLVAIAVTLPLSTAEVERVFSQLKLIKTDHRCSLKTSTLDMLLNVKLNCDKGMHEKLRSSIVQKFFQVKDRRLSKAISSYMKTV